MWSSRFTFVTHFLRRHTIGVSSWMRGTWTLSLPLISKN